MKNKDKSTISPAMQKLAGYVAGARRKALPAKVQEKTKHHVLDTLAAMVSGSRLAPGEAAIAFMKTRGGTPEAGIVGTNHVTSAICAAWANGMLAHADETDDSHAPSMTHPGCAIVGGSLAIGERERASGAALLRAVALGYDISARISLSLGALEFRRVGHLTHSFGPAFGAAAAGSSLMGFNERQVRHALSYTAQQSSGLSTYMRDSDHIEKAWDFGGMPARNGVSAVMMVASGCTAVEDVFSGERNFYVAFDESGRTKAQPNPQELVRALGSTYEIMNTNIKRWSVGSPIQAALDSLYELIKTHGVRAADVKHATVRIYASGANTVNNRDMPDICLQHLVACMLLDGVMTFETAHDVKRMREPKVLAVRKKIELIGDENLQKRLPHRHGIVELQLNDGRTLKHHTKAVRGTAQNPMTREEVDEKAYLLMKPILGARRARTVCDTVWNLEKIGDVRALRRMLKA